MVPAVRPEPLGITPHSEWSRQSGLLTNYVFCCCLICPRRVPLPRGAGPFFSDGGLLFLPTPVHQISALAADARKVGPLTRPAPPPHPAPHAHTPVIIAPCPFYWHWGPDTLGENTLLAAYSDVLSLRRAMTLSLSLLPCLGWPPRGHAWQHRILRRIGCKRVITASHPHTPPHPRIHLPSTCATHTSLITAISPRRRYDRHADSVAGWLTCTLLLSIKRRGSLPDVYLSCLSCHPEVRPRPY